MSLARPFLLAARLVGVAAILFISWMTAMAVVFGIAPSAPKARQANPLSPSGPLHILTQER